MLPLMMLACIPAQAGPTADVMLVSGDVTIHRSGSEMAATSDLDLFADDRIVTGADGSVIVVLKNRHVIRLDGDLELAVKDIAMLGAPASTTEPKAQLAMLLFPDEFDAVSIENAERVAGWDMRRGATLSVGGAEDDEMSEGVAEKVETTEALPTPAAAPPPPPPAVERRRQTSKLKPRVVRGSSGRGGSRKAEASVPAPPDFARQLSQIHGKCLADWKAAQSIDATELDVRVFFRDNKVVRVTSRQGYALPRCLSVQSLEETPVEAWQSTPADIELVVP